MLKVQNIRVRSFDLDHLYVLWDIEPTTEDPLKYDFWLEKSDAEFSGFHTLVGPFTDRYLFKDNTLRGQKSFFRKWYYRIRVQLRGSGDDPVYFPENGRGVCVRAEPDLQALEMARNERIRLREVNGRTVWVFPVRTFGQKCPVCSDSSTGIKRRSTCLTCFDTTFVGGYHRPLEVKMQITTPPQSTTAADLGEIENVNGQGKLANFPEVAHRWLVVEADNTRWLIGEGIRRIEKARALVRQEFPLHRPSNTDVVYKIPIELDSDEMADLRPYEERQYTHSQDLTEEQVPDEDMSQRIFKV